MFALHNLTLLNFFAIGVGAALGAWLRWLLGIALNPLLIALPLGTLAANLIGVAVGLFHINTHYPPAWKQFAITGFLSDLSRPADRWHDAHLLPAPAFAFVVPPSPILSTLIWPAKKTSWRWIRNANTRRWLTFKSSEALIQPLLQSLSRI